MKAHRDNNPYLQQDTGEDDEIEILEVVGIDDANPGRDPARTNRLDRRERPVEELVLSLEDQEEAEIEERPTGPLPARPADVSREPLGPPGTSDVVLRLRADYDNLRKRMARDREEYHRRANSALVGRLLPVFDNFERAITVAPKDPVDRSFQEGVVMIYRQLTEELVREGLQPIEAVGQLFDPSVHDAVATDPNSPHPPNTVVEELLRGYLFRGLLLRPARVKVSTAGDDGFDEGEVS